MFSTENPPGLVGRWLCPVVVFLYAAVLGRYLRVK
jgi:hypothetical protein